MFIVMCKHTILTPQYEKCSLVQVIMSHTLVISNGSHFGTSWWWLGLVGRYAQPREHTLHKTNSLHQQQ